jgi:hypothetical protein
MLLLDRHGHRILMRVAMESSAIVPLSVWGISLQSHLALIHFMSSIPHHSTFFRKRLEGVSGNKEGGLDVIFGEEL